MSGSISHVEVGWIADLNNARGNLRRYVTAVVSEKVDRF
jgi:hypothetical protein